MQMQYDSQYGQYQPVDTRHLPRIVALLVRKWYLFILGFVLLLLVILFSNYGFINVSVVGGDNSTILIRSQEDHEKTYQSTNTGPFKKLVRKGSYEVVATGEATNNGFVIIESEGFFQTKNAVVKLREEAFREFIGDSPNACMTMPGNLLISSPCGLSQIETRVHVMATEDSAPSIKEVATPIEIISVVQTADEVVAIGFEPADQSENLVGFNIDDGGNYINRRSFGESDGASYGVSVAGGGFLLYKTDFSEIKFYENLASKEQERSIDRPDVEESKNPLTPLSLSSNGTNIVTTHVQYELSGNTDDGHLEGEGDPEDVNIDAVRSYVTIAGESDTEIYELKGSFSSAYQCGTMYCLRDKNTLKVYGVDGNELKERYSFSEVDDLQIDGDNIFVITNEGVLKFNTSEQAGYFVYRFGDYIYCGSTVSKNKLLLCINDGLDLSRSRRVIVLDVERSVVDEIDKQVFALAVMDELNSIAPYKQYIHLALNTNLFGDLVLDSDGEAFYYSQSAIERVSKDINDKVIELDINTDYYKLINPFN